MAQFHFRCADEGDTTLAPSPSTPEIPGACSQKVPGVPARPPGRSLQHRFPHRGVDGKACAEASAQNAACTARSHDLGDRSSGTGQIAPLVSGGSMRTRRPHCRGPRAGRPPAETASGASSLGVLFKYPSLLSQKCVVSVWFSAKEKQKTILSYCTP